MSATTELKSVVFETTTRCNLACRYCYNVHKMPDGPPAFEDGFKRSKKTLEQLLSLAAVPQITMSGGEPFESERFLELCLYCRMKGLKVAVISNGTKGTRNDYRSLCSIGVRTFQIPIHSPYPGEHDAMTGVPGSHAKVLVSIDILRGLGARVVPVIVLTKINAASLAENLRFLHGLGLNRIMMNRFNVGGAGIRFRELLEPSIEELCQAFGVANELSVELGLRISSNVCSPACVLDPRDYRHIGFSRCSPDVARRPLTLDPSGNLRFCNHSPHILGNLFSSSLAQMFASEYARSWQHVPALCTDCPKWQRCFGGCRAAAEQLGGSVRDADPLVQPSASRASNVSLPMVQRGISSAI